MNINDTLNLISTIIQTRTSVSVSQGSGFFYSKLGPKDGDGSQRRTVEDIWLVTNRHVLLPRWGDKELSPNSVIFNLRKLDNANKLAWEQVVLSADDLSTLAMFHSDKAIDVAVINISELVKSRFREGGKYYLPYLLNADNFAGKNNIDVEASSDVLIVGYPKGFYDDTNLFPIIKSGIIATRWGVGFRGEPQFLIDAKLFPGSSGSVVLSKPTDIVVKDGQLMHSREKQFAFLGIYSGEPILEENPVEIGDLTIVRKSGFDLGTVWYAELVEDILDSGVLLSDLGYLIGPEQTLL